MLITHKGWNAADVRSIMREPEVCRTHPDPTAAERLWVCERNVPPIGSWLLNYTAMEDEDLAADQRAAMERWEVEEGGKEVTAQRRDTTCGCFQAVVNPGDGDIWKGHICTADTRKFNSPLVRSLLLKGHAFKMEQGEETLLQELNTGLDGHIHYKTRGGKGDPAQYDAWKRAIQSRVKERLGRGESTLYPRGGTGQKEVADLQRHLVFLKEDRAPHVVVGLCKYRYMLERDRYLYGGQTFQRDTEESDNILKRHWEYEE